MPDYDAGFKIVARNAGRQLAEMACVVCQGWKPLVSEVQTTERLADRAFLARHGRERFVVYMEAYTNWRLTAPWSVLAKSGLLSERERLPTVSLVYILRPRGYRSQHGQFRLEVGGETTQQVLFREIRMCEQEPQTWWEETPGLMALYPLCRTHDRPRAVVSHAAGVIRERATDTIVRADLLTTLYIFGKLVYPGTDLLGMIGREQMRESKAYEEIMALGRCEAKQEFILEALSTRFGSERAEELRAAITGLEDPQRLTRLFRLALSCSRLDEFRKAFERN